MNTLNKASIALINYRAGNLASVKNALARLGTETFDAFSASDLKNADKIIFPGVGHAFKAMQILKAANLVEAIKDFKGPVLGICLGMQLLAEISEEGPTPCLGIIPQKVEQFRIPLKVPHMGWNTVKHQNHPLFGGIADEAWFYFVHSYYIPVGMHSIATTSYHTEFTAAVAKENFFGLQFHPEKSAQNGLQILKNFIQL